MLPIAIMGAGKIARDQHVPAIAASRDFTLAAAVTEVHAPLPGVANFRTITEMKAAMPSITAIALCTPPHGRYGHAMEAFSAGLDVLNEKPPAATLSLAEDMVAHARMQDRVFYQSWHSREAGGVAPARDWLRDRRLQHVAVNWKEDVRVWHPGQEWMWDPGIGAFDPGINALSVITHILPHPLHLERAELRFPQNKAAPVAAELRYADTQGTPVDVMFDIDHRGEQVWEIVAETSAGTLKLSMGGARLEIDGSPVEVSAEPEYPRLYRRFAEFLRSREMDADMTPFRHVADAFMQGQRVILPPFFWDAPAP